MFKKREDDEYYEWLKGQKEGTSGFEDLVSYFFFLFFYSK